VRPGIRNENRTSTTKQSLKVSFAVFLFLLPVTPLLHAQNETPAQTAARYQKSCDVGNAPDCIHLAEAYVAGTGVTKDADKANALIEKAAAFYQKACDGGDANACLNLGEMWVNYAKNNYDLANPLFRKACDGGNATGCQKLGVAYKFGYGFPEDNAQAAAFYQKACDGGNAEGCLDGGFMHGLGLEPPVPQDHARANALFRKGCDGRKTSESYYNHQIASACNQLGIVYERGIGVPVDKAQAAAFYRKACEGGYTDACDSLKHLR
jgi:hypothetical protein